VARRVITEQLMALGLPGGRRLRLGRDLEAPVPHLLATIEHPELAALLARIEAAAVRAPASGADDWADLHQRLRYIAALFRAFAAEPTLAEAPFSAEQVAALRAGRMPPGPL
jgi:hypothetical protein